MNLLNRKFLISPSPKTEETIDSYLSRVLQCNGYKKISYIKQYKAEKFEYIPMFNQDKLLKLTDLLSEKKIKELFLSEEIISLCMNNAFVGKYGLLINSIRVCPQCLKEGPYHRKIWGLIGYTTCHIHNYLMLSHCICGKKIRSLSTELLFCKCGRDYRLMNIIYVKQKMENHNTYLYSRMMDRKNNDAKTTLLCSLTVDAAIEIVLRFSKCILDLNKVKTNSWVFLKDTLLLHKLLEEVYGYFTNWPRNFHKLLKKLDDGMFNNTLIYLMNELNRDQFMILSHEIACYIKMKNTHNLPDVVEHKNDFTELLKKTLFLMEIKTSYD
ncbi:TniQ family protein [Paenibacillus sp. FSL K6-2524]|uniref:TniQ family protein n=1 Tax=Paenibacillus sp. FSL K6-2524 TaxID=2954516 RepID=UPI0030FBB9E0